MECFIVEQSNVREESRELWLVDEEAHHAQVLRLRVGEHLLVTNLMGTCYECRLEEVVAEKRKEPKARCSILQVLPAFGEPEHDVMLVQAILAQPARWEWLLEKATELGVRIIQPVSSERTEPRSFKPERAERVLRAAVKQCRRANKPWLRTSAESELSSLEEALAYAGETGRSIFMLHEAAKPVDDLRTRIAAAGFTAEKSRIAVVIGPEGGFSDAEIALAQTKYGATIASLGTRRLRAETAAIAALVIAIPD